MLCVEWKSKLSSVMMTYSNEKKFQLCADVYNSCLLLRRLITERSNPLDVLYISSSNSTRDSNLIKA